MQNEKTSDAFGVLMETAQESFRAVMDGAAATQRQNLSLMWGWMDGPAEKSSRPSGAFEEQMEINRRTMRALAEQFERQQEAMRVLLLESSRAYMSLSPASFVPRDRGAARGDGQSRSGDLPIEGYDGLGVEEISGKLGDLNGSEIERLRMHEKQHKNRKRVLEQLDRSLV